MNRIPTSYLQQKRSEIGESLIDSIRGLPTEDQIRILGQFDDDQLFNVCLIDQTFLVLCLDPFLQSVKNWSREEYWAFIIQFNQRCNFEHCKNALINLLADPKFIKYYNYIKNNAYVSNAPSKQYEGDILDTILNVTTIMFKDNFNSPINIKPFINLNYVIFDDKFNQYIDRTMIPPNVESLTFKNDFNQPINKLPDYLKELILGNNFNQPIDNLPDSLEILELGNDFNQPITKLPYNLNELTFGNNFNQPINNIKYGPKLKMNKFGEKFNKNVDKLTTLK